MVSPPSLSISPVYDLMTSSHHPPPPSQLSGPADFEDIFRRARSESRVILTTSKNLIVRSACPEAVLVNQSNLELSLLGILDRYDIELDREKFLTVCGKCGGNIITCEGEMYREIIRKKHSIIENRKIGGLTEEEGESLKKGRVEGEDVRGEEEYEQETKANEEMTICGARCQVPNGCDAGSSEEAIPWVPRDREIFMCESCCQVQCTHNHLPHPSHPHPSPIPLLDLLCGSLTGGMNKRNRLLHERWFLLIISTMS